MSAERDNAERVINLGANSIWAKFQVRATTEAALPDQAVTPGVFPDTGTSLFVSKNGHSLSPELQKPETTVHESKWQRIGDKLVQKHQEYLEELDRLRKATQASRFRYVMDEKFTPDVIRSLIRRRLMPLQPEHLVLYLEQVMDGLPEKYQEAAWLDHKVRFCASEEFREIMYTPLTQVCN